MALGTMGIFTKHPKSTASPKSNSEADTMSNDHLNEKQKEDSPISVVEPPMFQPKDSKHELHKGHKPTTVTTLSKKSNTKVAPYPKTSPKKTNNNGITTNNGTTITIPVQKSRERTSTALITTKETSQHLQDKAVLKPPLNGTSSTALWVASANQQQNSDRDLLNKSQHSTASYYEEILGEDYDDDHEYDSNFFEYIDDDGMEQPHSSSMIMLGDSSFPNMPPRKITIRFDEYDEMQTCLHINDYTKHEISRSWYKREDYDRMVDLARKTAAKAVKREKELQEELESMLGRNENDFSRKGTSHNGDESKKSALSHPYSEEDSGNDHHEDEHENENGGDTKNSKRNNRNATKNKKKKPIEYRGLEAWTPDGAAKVRLLKESAIELVWSEQSRQWEEGTFDAFAISSVYIPVALTASLAAHERGLSDERIVKKLLEQEELRAIKKKNRTMYKRSKAVLKKTAKTTGLGLVHGTGKIVSKTGQVGKKLGKRGVKAGVATATLDPRMMKEALKLRVTGNKKRECVREKIITTSRAAHERDAEEEESHLQQHHSEGQLSYSNSNLSASNVSSSSGVHLDDYSKHSNTISVSREENIDGLRSSESKNDTMEENSSIRSGGSHPSSQNSNNHNETKANHSMPLAKKKKSKLKLLGVVPIPGTQKVYKEERREMRAEKRIQKMSRRPSWEAGISTGKY